jgi:hypothetical protein
MDINEFLPSRIEEDVKRAEHVREYGDTGGIFSPERVLAECEAKRTILALHEYEWMGPDDAAGKGCAHDYEDWPCPTLRSIAAVYKDHPDYRQEWA